VHDIDNKTKGRAYSNRFQCVKEFAWNIGIRCWSRVNQNSKTSSTKEHLTLTRDESAINESNERSGLHFRRCLLLECKVEYKLLNFQTLLKRRNARRQRNSISFVFSQRYFVAAIRLGAEKTKPEGYSAMSAPRSSYKSKIVNHAVLNRDRGCDRTVITADEMA
jgi:hypothetical protein